MYFKTLVQIVFLKRVNVQKKIYSPEHTTQQSALQIILTYRALSPSLSKPGSPTRVPGREGVKQRPVCPALWPADIASLLNGVGWVFPFSFFSFSQRLQDSCLSYHTVILNAIAAVIHCPDPGVEEVRLNPNLKLPRRVAVAAAALSKKFLENWVF